MKAILGKVSQIVFDSPFRSGTYITKAFNNDSVFNGEYDIKLR